MHSQLNKQVMKIQMMFSALRTGMILVIMLAAAGLPEVLAVPDNPANETSATAGDTNDTNLDSTSATAGDTNDTNLDSTSATAHPSGGNGEHFLPNGVGYYDNGTMMVPMNGKTHKFHLHTKIDFYPYGIPHGPTVTPDPLVGCPPNANSSSAYAYTASRAKCGLAEFDPLNNKTATQQQLSADSRYWVYGGDAPAENATYSYYEDPQGLHIGVKAPSNGTYAGFYAAGPNTTSTLFHAALTAPVRTVPSNNNYFQNGMYVQTAQGSINYVTCVSVTNNVGTVWVVVHASGTATSATQFDLLWVDNSPNQSLTRDCTIVTNGDNYLKVYLDGALVYAGSNLNLQMPMPFNVYMEPQSSYAGQLLYGTYNNYYETTSENMTLSGAPPGTSTVNLVDTAGNTIASSPVKSGSAVLDLGRYLEPVNGSIVLQDMNNNKIGSTPAVSGIFGGDAYVANLTASPSLAQSGLVAHDPLNNQTATLQQLQASQQFWSYGGDTPTYSVYENQQGLHIGVKAPSNGTYGGYTAASPPLGVSLLHAVVTVKVRSLNTTGMDFQGGLYADDPDQINYATCVAITQSDDTYWSVVAATGNTTTANQYNVLYTDTSPGQPLKRDCTIVTNGTNFLAVYLDHILVYTNSSLNLQLKPSATSNMQAGLESETSYGPSLLEGIYKDFYATTGQDITVNNLPPNAATVRLVGSSGSVLESSPVTSGTAQINIAKYHFPLAVAINVYDSSNGLVATTQDPVSAYGGNVYTYRVTTINSTGSGSPPSTVTVPQSPTGLVATAGNAQVSLSWSAPSSNGGSAITGYNVYRGTTAGGESSVPVATVTTSTYADTGLTNGQTYYYTVKAVNSAGTSAASNEASATPSASIASTITVYAHRIPAPYWDPCFAITCSAGTGPGASMWIALYNSVGGFIEGGFADENGFNFTGLNPTATYYVYPTDCDSCHGSTHDVIFQYWGDNNSTVRPRAATVGASLDAWYSCTNNCSGGP